MRGRIDICENGMQIVDETLDGASHIAHLVRTVHQDRFDLQFQDAFCYIIQVAGSAAECLCDPDHHKEYDGEGNDKYDTHNDGHGYGCILYSLIDLSQTPSTEYTADDLAGIRLA